MTYCQHRRGLQGQTPGLVQPVPCQDAEVETCSHALFQCLWNDGIGERVLACIGDYVPDLLPEQALRLDFRVTEEQELAIVWIMASALLILWKLRNSKSRVQLYKVRAQMEANINLLRETRHSNTAIILDQLVDRYF